MSDTHWVLHPLQRSLGDHGEAWDTLRRRLFGPNALLCRTFVNALLQHFGTGRERLAVLLERGEPQAMCVLQPQGHLRWSSFLPAQAQVGPTLIADPKHLEGLVQALPGPVIEVDLLCNDPEFGGLAERAFVDTHSIDHNLTMHIDLTGRFGDYWASRSKKLVQNMERYRRRMDAQDVRPRLASFTDAAELPAAVARYAALDAQGWKGRQQKALGSDDRQLSFYTDVLHSHAERGAAIAWELWFGDRLVASRLAIREDNTLVMLKTTYSEVDAAYAPGRELLRRVVECCFESMPGGRIEFYTDASADQLQWATGHRWIRHVALYRHLAARMAVAAARFLPSSRGGGAGVHWQTNDIRVNVYRDPGEFPASVLNLFAEAEGVSMQFGIDWYRNLLDQVFRDHAGVKFYVLEHLGKPVAALPLLATRTRLGWRLQSLGNYYTSLYGPALSVGVRGRDLSHLFKAVLSDHPGLATIQLWPLATEAASFRTLQRALNCAGLACFPYFCFGNWFMPVRGDAAAYMKSRSSQVRNTVARMGKKFAAAGGRLEIVDSRDVERGVSAYEQVYGASWKRPEPYPGFMPGLIRLCAARGWLRLGVAWLNDKPIAAQVWIVANGKADIYKLAYDEAYKAYSPGTLLTAMLMAQAMDVDKVAEIDYLTGDDPYKASWMETRRERWGLVAYNPRSLVGLSHLLREVLRQAVKRLHLPWKSTRGRPSKSHAPLTTGEST